MFHIDTCHLWRCMHGACTSARPTRGACISTRSVNASGAQRTYTQRPHTPRRQFAPSFQVIRDLSLGPLLPRKSKAPPPCHNTCTVDAASKQVRGFRSPPAVDTDATTTTIKSLPILHRCAHATAFGNSTCLIPRALALCIPHSSVAMQQQTGGTVHRGCVETFCH
jgi:hypothetical protein